MAALPKDLGAFPKPWASNTDGNAKEDAAGIGFYSAYAVQGGCFMLAYVDT